MGRHVSLWMVLLVAAALVVPALLPPPAMIARVNAELDTVVSAFGAREARRVVERANRQYEQLFARSGPNGLMSSAYLQSFAGNAYSMLLRLNVLAVWMPFVVPFLVAALIDGAMRRRIKLTSFGYFSPALLSLALHAAIAMAFLPALYLIVPLPMSPHWIPIWALLASAPLMALAANLQRVRG